MKPFYKILSLASIITLILLMAIVSTALAITITVDGSRESAWDGGGTQSDPNEAAVTNDGVDLVRVQWTNDTSNMYFLFETYAITNWNRTPQRPYIWMCMNTDNNTSTGSTFPGVCPGSGYDRYVLIEGPTPLSVTVYDELFGVIGAATSVVATSGAITELSIDNASLGFTSTNCGLASSSVLMDGRTNDPDDNVRDTEDIPLTCGDPTAISMSSFYATAHNPAGTTIVAVLVLLGAVTSVGIVWRRRRDI
jgi:hypothetical protein